MPSRSIEQQDVTLTDILAPAGVFEVVNERIFNIPVGWAGLENSNEMEIGARGEEIERLVCESFTVGPCFARIMHIRECAFVDTPNRV